MKKWVYLAILISVVIFVSIIPNIPLPFSFSEGLSNFFISTYNILTEWLPFVFLFLLGILGIIILTMKKFRFKAIRFLFFMFLIIIVAFFSFKYLSPVLRDYSKGNYIAKLNPLNDALENYKKKNGLYPERLSMLLNGYIDEVPFSSVLTIRTIEYRRDNEDYTLLFVQYINDWNVEIVMYNSMGIYDDSILNLKKFGKWRYFSRIDE